MTHLPSVPVRVAFCITELDPGGAERALVELVSRLNPQEWSPCVIALGTETPLAKKLRDQHIPVTCLGARGVSNMSILFPLIRLLREFQPAILQTWLFHANLLGRLAAWAAGVPVVFSGVRVAERSAGWHVRWERWTRHLVTHHVCVSHGVADFVRQQQGVQVENLSIIPNGVDWERFACAQPAELERFGIPAGSTTVLGVGRLEPQKGWLDLLEAVRPLLQSRSGLHLLILGEGSQRRELETWIARNLLQGRIHLPGWMTEVPEVMRAADLFVLASHWEGMPNVLLEAMAAGLPVVATDVEGVADVIGPDTGVVVNRKNVSELRSAITELLDDPERRRTLGSCSQHYVKMHFTWSNSAEMWTTLARKLLKR